MEGWPAALGLAPRGLSVEGGKLGRAVLGCERGERAEEREAMGLRKGGSGSGRFLGLGWFGCSVWAEVFISLFYLLFQTPLKLNTI